ncbi:MAG: CvpA family protein [Chitinophagaceae bacterium]|jgi:membrane protein required for colicin V production|nr:CvpA family protein [Chitinophagaceae bacterium]OQY92725.1 MAG: colicin V production protein [Sphingobacteriales bacterium UTBCD1]
MLLDIIFALVIIAAMIKGYRRGLIVGAFSFIALFVGLAAAIKLSAVVAGYLGKSAKISEQWLPLLAFVLVFLIVALLVHLLGKFIEKSVQIVMLGWLNRLGGMVFYIALYVTIFSVILFYLEQMKVIQPATISRSATYSFVQPWGPKAINSLSSIVPAFENMFRDLQDFFGNLSQKMA